MIIAVDIGTTNMKAACVDEAGTMGPLAVRFNATARDGEGCVCYDPELLWSRTAELIAEAAAAAGNPLIEAVSLTSMAESGLLVNRATGAPLSSVIPWFERSSMPQAERVEREIDACERFAHTGIRPSFKTGLAKLLRLRDSRGGLPAGGVWLSVSAYIAFRLTGRFAEDYTLAARTYAFRIDSRTWDAPLIRHFGLEPDLFPDIVDPGDPIGTVDAGLADRLGLQPGTAVCLAGHDHVCASVAVGAVRPGEVYNSIGTAETMVGTFEARTLGRDDFSSGLGYGLHAVPGQMFWMGGHSTSGGSVEWMRELLGGGKLSYREVLAYLQEAGSAPTGILFFPYLAGSGAPDPNPKAEAAFIGLTSAHGKAAMLKAVLEGNAFQMEAIRRRAETAAGIPIRRMRAVGGGVNNPVWMQIKADVSGAAFTVPAIPEATLLGAALCAGIGTGRYASFAEAAAAGTSREPAARFEPDAERHNAYREIYETGFSRLRSLLFGTGIG